MRVQMTLNPDCTVVEVPRFAPVEWGNALDWYDATVRACQHTRVLRQCAPVSTMLCPDCLALLVGANSRNKAAAMLAWHGMAWL